MNANVHRIAYAPVARFLMIAALVAVGMFATAREASGQDAADEDGENTVTIVNASDQPLTYQILRAVGATWTGPYELPAGKVHKYNAPERGRSPLATLTSHEEQPGFIILRARMFQGYASAKVKAGGTFWYLFDKHNNARLIRAQDKASAGRRLAEINRNLAEVSDEERARLIRQARANHTYRGQ